MLFRSHLGVRHRVVSDMDLKIRRQIFHRYHLVRLDHLVRLALVEVRRDVVRDVNLVVVVALRIQGAPVLVEIQVVVDLAVVEVDAIHQKFQMDYCQVAQMMAVAYQDVAHLFEKN